jgi:phosphatidylinositol glycan class A protein
LINEEKIIKKKLNVLHVTPFYPPDKGGISNLVYHLCRLLYQHNNNIHIMVSRRLNNKNNQNISNIDLIEIKSLYLPGWPYSTLRSFSFPLENGFKINSIIKKGKFDIVHVHGHHYPICWIAIKSAYKYGITTILSLHGTYALNPNVLGGKSLVEEIFNKSILRHILSKTTVVIGGTKQIIEYAKRYGESSKYIIIPNGVELSKFKSNIKRKSEFRKKYHIRNERIVVLFVGRFEDVKGVMEFANAAKLILKNYPNTFEIVLVGGGKLESNVKSIIKESTDIHFFQWISNDIIHEIYIASDIFVLPSKFEALPLTIIEAMNAHLFIIYTQVGGVEDILKGYSKKKPLYKVTSEEICKILITVVKDGIYLRESIDSYNYAEKFSWENIAFEIDSLYRKLIA